MKFGSNLSAWWCYSALRLFLCLTLAACTSNRSPQNNAASETAALGSAGNTPAREIAVVLDASSVMSSDCYCA